MAPARATAADDPGYLASIASPTPLGRLRLVMATLALAPVVLLGLAPVLAGRSSAPLLLVALPPLLAVTAAALTPVMLRPAVPALPRQLPRAEAAATAAGLLRQTSFLRLALAEAPLLAGFALSAVAGGPAPYYAAFVVGWPLLLVSCLPTRGRVEALRTRLEADGAATGVWDLLLAAPSKASVSR